MKKSVRAIRTEQGWSKEALDKLSFWFSGECVTRQRTCFMLHSNVMINITDTIVIYDVWNQQKEKGFPVVIGKLPGWKTYGNQETFCILLPVLLIALVSSIKIGHGPAAQIAVQTYHNRPSAKLSWSHFFHWKINLMPLYHLCDTFFLGQTSQTAWWNGLVGCGERWRTTDDDSWAFFTLSKPSHTVHLIRKCHFSLGFERGERFGDVCGKMDWWLIVVFL